MRGSTHELGATHGVSLFVGPRGAWDTGGQSIVGAAVGGAARGAAGVEWCVAEVRRAVALGIRSLLVADVGVLASLGAVRRAGDLPTELILKTSVLLPCANPETARVLEGLGAGTINVSTDLFAAELGELRGGCSAPLDVYVGGAGRPGRVRALLRGAGDDPPRRADVREARST